LVVLGIEWRLLGSEGCGSSDESGESGGSENEFFHDQFSFLRFVFLFRRDRPDTNGSAFPGAQIVLKLLARSLFLCHP
jgi:hypothetical protein